MKEELPKHHEVIKWGLPPISYTGNSSQHTMMKKKSKRYSRPSRGGQIFVEYDG
mgnify:CR=1 FL=1